MQKTKKFLSVLYRNEIGRIILAGGVTLVFFAALYFKSDIVFFINDDENILYTLAGYYTGGVTADHPFVNYILGKGIRTLYEIAPNIPWYGCFHVCMLFFSILIIGKSILKETYYSNRSLLSGISIFSSMTALFFVFPVVLMQFTTTSALSGTASIALLYSADNENDNKIIKIMDYLFSIIFLILCYMHRKNTGNVIICFYALIAVYRIFKCLLKNKQKKIKHNVSKMRNTFVCFGVCIVSVLAVSFYSQNIVRSTASWDAYYEYDNARFKMTDYPHDSIEENPELYSEIEWPESLYKLSGTYYWFFMDERVNQNSFNAISETGYYNNSDFDISQILENALSLFENENIARINLATILIVFLMILVVTLIKVKRYWMELLLACCTIGGSLLMSLYLCWKGRFILRAFQVIAFPTIIILTLCLINVIQHIITNGNLKKKAFSAILIIAIGIFVLNTSRKAYWSIADESKVRAEKSMRTQNVENYAIQHSDNVYIYDTSLTFRYLPFVTYENEQPSNLFFWGGMGWNSPAFYQQLQINNLEDLYSDVFFDENVYYITYDGFITDNGKTMKDLFMEYMIDTYGDVEMSVVDTISEGITVYKLSRK